MVEAKKITHWIRSKKADFWQRTEAKELLALFKKTASKVPAYKKFLARHRVKSNQIRTVADLATVPTIHKANYLKKNRLIDLTLDGELKKPLVFTSTSGSTGVPFYFHRSAELDEKTSAIHELFFTAGQYKTNEPVLIVVCFGMGVWIGGLITYQAFKSMQERGYNLAIITPGINKEEIFKALKHLGPSYRHIILAGYPPFIKDIIDEAPSHGIDWHKFKVRLLFAAEVFTERFRDYVSRTVGITNPYCDTMNIYGTADLGAMAFETPLAILIRRLCAKNRELFEAIFPHVQKTPTFAQYIPSFISFDTDGQDLLVSGDNSLPLVRYALGDHGGVYSFKEMVAKLAELGINLKQEAKKAGIEKFWYELPFVYVYERADFSTSLYGLQVYPEPVREALLKKPLSTYLTGKFTMETRFDNKQNQYLHIHLEMRRPHNGTLPQSIRRAVLNALVEHLELNNSEYRELRKFLGKRALPRMTFWQAEDPEYFKPGIKQRWVKKQK